MDLQQVLNLLLFIFLLVLSSFFSATETAFLSYNKIRMKNLSDEGDKRAQKVLDLSENSDKLFATILVANNLANIGASSLVTAIVIAVFGDGGTLVALSAGVVTLLILIFGEITPKSFATKHSENIALKIAFIISGIVYILRPVVFVLNLITKFIIKILKAEGETMPTITEEELKTIVNVGHEEGIIEESEKDMIHNVFEFNDTEVREIMTPRVKVDSLDENISYHELIKKFQQGQYSRYPVHDDSFDQIIGVIHVKDLLFTAIDEDNFDIKDFMREPFVVYEFNLIQDVFASMRSKHMSLAIVLDEYGLMSGIVTLEDIIEEIVGEIDDEYDITTHQIVKLSNNEYVVDGSISLFDINDEIGTEFESEDFESIGGLILGEVKSVPKVNDVISIENVDLKILRVVNNRIDRLKITINELENTSKKD